MISVVGYGSLLSEQSARETVPGLRNFRLVRVPGYRRIFNKVGIVFFSRHGASRDELRVASCSTEPAEGMEIFCSQFECSESDFRELYEREHRFRWAEVQTLALVDDSETQGRICTRYSDIEYRLNKCVTSQEYHERVGQYYDGPIWRDDILPFPRYLAFCLQAAESQGEAVLNNFMDSTFLADGVTTIRSYLDTTADLVDWRLFDTGYSYRR